MKRTHALASIFSIATASLLTGAAWAEDKAPTVPEVKRFVPIPVTTADGKKGVVTPQSTGGKTSYYFSIGGKPAAPGIYTVAGGQHVKVVSVDGLVDAANSTIMLNPQPLPP